MENTCNDNQASQQSVPAEPDDAPKLNDPENDQEDANPVQQVAAPAEQLPLYRQLTTKGATTRLRRTIRVPQRLITSNKSVARKTQDAFINRLHKDDYAKKLKMINRKESRSYQQSVVGWWIL